MDLLSLLATVILFTTVGTLMIALAAYLAYKLREKRRPSTKQLIPNQDHMEPIFLKRYVPEPAYGPTNMPSTQDTQN
jgi:uncharacterized membrane protein YfcA